MNKLKQTCHCEKEWNWKWNWNCTKNKNVNSKSLSDLSLNRIIKKQNIFLTYH